MNNQEFSKLAKQVLRIAKSKLKKETIKKFDDAYFNIELMNDKSRSSIEMCFISKNGRILFNREYDLRRHEFKD